MITPRATAKSAPPMRRTIELSMNQSWGWSDLDVDDLAHPEEAHDHRDDGGDEHPDADGIGEEHADVLRVEDVHDDAEAGRQAAEHDGAHAAFSGERGDVTAEALALDHGVGHGHQELGQVATDLALDADGHDRPGEVR